MREEIKEMKKIVNLRCYVAIGTDDYADTSIWNHIRYIEVEEPTEYTLETWKEAYEAIKTNHVRNAEVGLTMFGKRDTIEIGWGDLYQHKSVMTEKKFIPIHVKWVWEDVTRNYSIKDLADLLPAKQFCEWLKDQGITQIGSF
jgi:hypothetical protein